MAKKEKGYKSALENLIEDKGLVSTIVIEALTEALAKSYKKNYCGTESIVDCKIDGDGQIRIFITHHVVDDVNDEDYEYSIEEAQEIDPKYQVGDEVVEEADISEFGRLAAIQTKQLLRQKIREAEKEALYNEYINKLDEIINGTVDRVEERFAIINIGKTGALLSSKDQIPGETLVEGEHVKVYVSEVERTTKGTHISVLMKD